MKKLIEDVTREAIRKNLNDVWFRTAGFHAGLFQ
jgi:hypothetical protein